ncbi:hypothetical protein SteCoe_27660 [Stentor coeruleus]|uniref:Uncharacterized protein n=1 Tax=Stentor coeruleus TaxID=5963 RepID=A0A1R2BAA1_9CILI|nr:hypothetical protein SteCoe_27660 [Stentor coeruleus]
MSNNKESTLKTTFTLSMDTDFIDDSALISGFDFEDSLLVSKNPSTGKINDLINEIDLINEDRERLRLENENLKIQLSEIARNKLYIELLQKVATKALDELYLYKNKPKCLSPDRRFLRKIKIRSPSEGIMTSTKPLNDNDFVVRRNPSDASQNIVDNYTHNSPKYQRNTSARIFVSRNHLKYPKSISSNKNTLGEQKGKSIFQ